MMSKDERKKKIEELPDIFYRYKWDGNKIEKICIVKSKHIVTGHSHEVISFEYYRNGKTCFVSRPETIELDKYDAHRHSIFFKNGKREVDAAKAIQEYYADQLINLENETKRCIFTMRDINKFINNNKKEGETQ